MESMETNAAATSLALSKLSATPNARASLTPGVYNVDTTVRVSGTIRIGEDFTVAPTVNILNLNTLGLFIQYCGITREAAIANLRKAATDALNAEKAVGNEIANNCKEVKDMVERIQSELIATLPRQKRQGAVTTKLTVETLETVTA